MKNAMLFCIALLFSVSANAATLSLSTVGSNGATQEISLNNNSTVLAGGTVANSGSWQSLFDVTTDVDTPVRVEWSFNPSTSLDSAQLAFGLISGPGGNYVGFPTIYNITGDFIFTAILTAGSYFAVVRLLRFTPSSTENSGCITPNELTILLVLRKGSFGSLFLQLCT